MFSFSDFDIVVDKVVWVSEQNVTKEWVFNTSLPKHKKKAIPKYYSLRYIARGSYDVQYNSGERDSVHENAFTFYNSNNIQFVQTSSSLPFNYYQIYFYTTEEIDPGFFRNGQKTIYPENKERIELLFIKAMDTFLEKTVTWRLELRMIVTELIMIFINTLHNKEIKKFVPRPIRKSAEYIQNNIFSGNIVINELAKEQNFSTEHFIRIFKEYYGKTPKQYIISLRLNRASELLKTTKRTIAEIADFAGFSNIFYFNKIFKQNFGMTPTEYRKKYSEEFV